MSARLVPTPAGYELWDGVLLLSTHVSLLSAREALTALRTTYEVLSTGPAGSYFDL